MLTKPVCAPQRNTQYILRYHRPYPDGAGNGADFCTSGLRRHCVVFLFPPLQALLREAEELQRGLDRLRAFAEGLVASASPDSDTTHIRKEVDDLTRRHQQLTSKLEDRCAQLESASSVVAQYNVSGGRRTSFAALILTWTLKTGPHIGPHICVCSFTSAVVLISGFWTGSIPR